MTPPSPNGKFIPRVTRAIRSIRPQDAVWVLLFAGLTALASPLDPSYVALLVALLAVQIVEPRLGILQSTRGKIGWILLKLVLGYLLVGYTGGVTSSYYLILLLPVISAATSLGVMGALLVTVLACATYLSFLFFVDFSYYQIEPDQVRVLLLRMLLLAMAGNAVNMLAEALRVQSAKNRAVAEQLAEANRSLHEAEDAVRRSERLAALGQLSAGLAHELRNPLGTIRASAEMLSRSVMEGGGEVAREVAGFISTEVDRANTLVTRFLEFARPLQLRLATADVSTVIDRAIQLLERDPAKYKVSVYRNYSPDLPPFAFDPDLLERVFYNLILNAAQVTAPGGAITVKTRASGGTAEIAVIDRGPGIAPEIREQIFNPFFTTKPEGVGLGLAIVSRIVDEHGGRISVESESGKGSVFLVYLPTQGKSALPEI